METKKLYYEDCHRKRFTAQVLECRQAGENWEILLDRTAFYPEGGGQACDLGTLGGVRVLAVREEEEQVLHLCDGPLPVDREAEGSIDWERRFDLMQQHTGEHIVSGIIHRLFGWHNVGFHVGADTVTIDFDGPIPEEELSRIQHLANEAVWQDLPVKCWYPAPEELPYVGYRSKRELPWPVRVVEVPGYDKCACCGVHVVRTGEIGLIKLVSCVKFHQGVRIEMVCGGRALAMADRVWEQNRKVSQLFSAKLLETAAAAEAVKNQLAEEKFRNQQLKRRIFRTVAERFAGKTHVFHVEPELDPGDVRNLADAIGQVCGGIAVVASCQSEGVFGLCLISRTLDVRPLGKAAFGALHGRGGGRADAVQGSVQATEAEIRNFFEAELNKIL